MRLQNTTNISDADIRQIIKFVKPNNVLTSKCTVRVTNCSGFFQGKFYPERHHIIARITPNENRFPYFVDRTPKVRRAWRRVSILFDKYNERTNEWESWHRTALYQSVKEKEKTFGSGYISHLLLSRKEALISVLAHELRHYWQENHKGKRGKVWGARGAYSDRDADAYAISKVREWRRIHNPTQIFPTLLWD
jgi:hypothetical protein